MMTRDSLNIQNPHPPTSIRSNSAVAGMMLFLSITYTWLFAAAWNIMGLPVNAAIWPIGCIAAILTAGTTVGSRLPLKDFLILSGGFLILLVVSAIIAGVTTDYSYDGNSYHQEDIALFMDGWTPLLSIKHQGYYPSEWAIHYPKGVEITQAAIALTCNHIECGKALNLIFMAAALFLSKAAISSLYPHAKRGYAWTVAAIATFNVIAVAQCLTYYIDFTLYYYILFSIIFIYFGRVGGKAGQQWGWCLLLTAAMAVATKFNAAFNQVLLTIIAVAIMANLRNKGATIRVATFSLIGGLLGLLLCYQPYITNWLDCGHPLYPLMGHNAEDIMTGLTPPQYLGRSRFVTFFMSLLSFYAPSVELRTGGFGPFMIWMLTLSLYCIFRYQKQYSSSLIAIIICIIASCFIFQQSWWARYISQLWLIVPIGVMPLLSMTPRKWPQRIIRMQATLVAATIALAAGFALVSSACATQWRKNIYEVTGNQIAVGRPSPQMARNMKEHGVTIIERNLKLGVPSTDPNSVGWFSDRDELWGPIIYLTPRQMETLQRKCDRWPWRYEKEGRISHDIF